MLFSSASTRPFMIFDVRIFGVKHRAVLFATDSPMKAIGLEMCAMLKSMEMVFPAVEVPRALCSPLLGIGPPAAAPNLCPVRLLSVSVAFVSKTLRGDTCLLAPVSARTDIST